MVECSGLENRQVGNGLEGSNPSPSASTKNNAYSVVFVCASEWKRDSKRASGEAGQTGSLSAQKRRGRVTQYFRDVCRIKYCCEGDRIPLPPQYAILGLMRRLGIDYGTKRVGLALSDEAGRMAFPHQVVPNDATLLSTLERLITAEGVGEIVIGHSKNLTGQDNPVQAGIEELVTDLTLATGLPVHLEPEQFTTQAALREQGRNDMTDASAAALILDSYLQKQG